MQCSSGLIPHIVKGRIASGMYADFAVLSDNPFDVDPHSIRVLQTVLDGRAVYRASLRHQPSIMRLRNRAFPPL